MYCGDTVINVVCIVGYSYTCCMYCGDIVIHVVCIVGDIVIHDVCIVGIQLYM